MTLDTGGAERIRALAFADNKILAVGTRIGGSQADTMLVARYLGDGTLDTTFGTGGLVQVDFERFYDRALDVAVQPDGKIIIASEKNGGLSGTSVVAVVRLNADGSLDPSFATAGLSSRSLLVPPDISACSATDESCLASTAGPIALSG